MLLNEMEIFYHVVEQRSFSKAAERLRVSKSFISKRINKLEQDLSVRLVSRSTRKLTLTEAGENFYRQCAKVVYEGEKGYSIVSELQGRPSGLLRISIPPALAMNLITPVFSKFLAEHPEVTLDIELESRLVDIVKGGYDLALRSAKLESSNLIAQKIYTINNVICATKEYLTTHGTPTTPTELINHNCAIYSYAKFPGRIELSRQGRKETLILRGNFMSNHLDLIKKLILSNTALGFLPEFMVDNELKNKHLTLCLPDYKLPTSNLYAIYPEREFMLPKLKLFLDMLKSYLSNS
tara:strand:+ start:5366 stop:6250 length:885 start_codon:yes stop_codon:yes gene_type:complete